MPLYARSKAKVTDERKENAFVAAKSDTERKRSPPVLARSGLELAANTKFAKKNEPGKSSSRTRYLADSEPRPKTLASKRRNVLALRKPGAAAGGALKAKDGPRPFPRLRARRRAADDDDPDRLKKIRLKAA